MLLNKYLFSNGFKLGAFNLGSLWNVYPNDGTLYAKGLFFWQ